MIILRYTLTETQSLLITLRDEIFEQIDIKKLLCLAYLWSIKGHQVQKNTLKDLMVDISAITYATWHFLVSKLKNDPEDFKYIQMT